MHSSSSSVFAEKVKLYQKKLNNSRRAHEKKINVRVNTCLTFVFFFVFFRIIPLLTCIIFLPFLSFPSLFTHSRIIYKPLPNGFIACSMNESFLDLLISFCRVTSGSPAHV